MIVLGLIALLVGYLASIGILVTVGWVLIAVGIILLLIGAVGNGVGGRKYWY